MTFLDNIDVEASHKVLPLPDAAEGQCECTLGGLYIWKLHDWGVLCTRRARYDVVLHLTDHPGDAMPFKMCGQHVRHWRQAGFQVDILGQLPGRFRGKRAE